MFCVHCSFRIRSAPWGLRRPSVHTGTLVRTPGSCSSRWVRESPPDPGGGGRAGWIFASREPIVSARRRSSRGPLAHLLRRPMGKESGLCFTSGPQRAALFAHLEEVRAIAEPVSPGCGAAAALQQTAGSSEPSRRDGCDVRISSKRREGHGGGYMADDRLDADRGFSRLRAPVKLAPR